MTRYWARLGCVVVAVLALAACVERAHLSPRSPGNRCDDSCPEGMRCWGTARRRSGAIVPTTATATDTNTQLFPESSKEQPRRASREV